MIVWEGNKIIQLEPFICVDIASLPIYRATQLIKTYVHLPLGFVQEIFRKVKDLHTSTGNQVCKALHVFASVSLQGQVGQAHAALTQSSAKGGNCMVTQAILRDV